MIVRTGDVYPGLDGLGSFLKKAAKATVGVAKIALVPVTGGASLLIPTPYSGGDSAPQADQATQEAAAQEAAAQAAAQAAAAQVQASQAAMARVVYGGDANAGFSRGFSQSLQPTVQPIQAGQYLIQPPASQPLVLPAPGSGRPAWLIPSVVGAVALGGLYLITRRKAS